MYFVKKYPSTVVVDGFAIINSVFKVGSGGTYSSIFFNRIDSTEHSGRNRHHMGLGEVRKGTAISGEDSKCSGPNQPSGAIISIAYVCRLTELVQLDIAHDAIFHRRV